jgi:hypothetical protein
LPDAIWVRK